MLSCRGYMQKLQRLYAGYSDNKANSAQFQLGLGLTLAKCTHIMIVALLGSEETQNT